jgi:hypothetical protein
MKSWEKISKGLTIVWLDDILAPEIKKPNPYRMTSKAKI